jgi:hypothetical protein
MKEGEKVEYFDGKEMQEGKITFRNGDFIEIEKEDGTRDYTYPWEVNPA